MEPPDTRPLTGTPRRRPCRPEAGPRRESQQPAGCCRGGSTAHGRGTTLPHSGNCPHRNCNRKGHIQSVCRGQTPHRHPCYLEHHTSYCWCLCPSQHTGWRCVLPVQCGICHHPRGWNAHAPHGMDWQQIPPLPTTQLLHLQHRPTWWNSCTLWCNYSHTPHGVEWWTIHAMCSQEATTLIPEHRSTHRLPGLQQAWPTMFNQLDEPTGFSGGLEQQLKYCDLIS